MLTRERIGEAKYSRALRCRPLLGCWLLFGLTACSSQSKDEGPLLSVGGMLSVAGTGGSLSGFGGAVGSAGTAPAQGGVQIVVPKASGGASGGNGTSGAGGGNGGRTVTENCAKSNASAVDVKTVRPADIIFAIDSSQSMDAEIQFTRTEMNAFSQQIVASGVDARVILIAERRAICIDAPLGSGQCPDADDNPPGYVHVPMKVGSHDALGQIIGTYPMWQQYLRPEATKSFVVITDDDATMSQIDSAALFTQGINALDPAMFKEWTFNGVYCFTQCPSAYNIGRVYAELVAQTSGVGGDLCLQDFKPVFDKLAEQIISNAGSTIACEWALPQAPTGQSFSRELVTVQRTTPAGMNPLSRVETAADCAQGGWHFDSQLNPTKILACANTCMDMQNQTGGKIDVTFGCEAVGSCIASSASSVTSAKDGGCEWPLPEPPPGQAIDYKSVNVRYTSTSGFASNLGNVASSADCGNVQHGWYFDDPAAPKKILACPQTCTEAQVSGTSPKVDVLFGCDTIPAPVK